MSVAHDPFHSKYFSSIILMMKIVNRKTAHTNFSLNSGASYQTDFVKMPHVEVFDKNRAELSLKVTLEFSPHLYL